MFIREYCYVWFLNNFKRLVLGWGNNNKSVGFLFLNSSIYSGGRVDIIFG